YNNHLQELSHSDFKIVDGEPNITGWEVRTELDADLGEVKELLFDPESRSVRYLVVELSAKAAGGQDNKKVLVPIGVAKLHESDDEVILPNVTLTQLSALPAYEKGQLTPENEIFIRNVLAGSPTAADGVVTIYQHQEFYTHPQFNDENFYRRDRTQTGEVAGRSVRIETRQGNSSIPPEPDPGRTDLI
ncbi:PRC-barrel domain-containing protein, partial [Pedobacter sp.]|uniref:PRC-barrel domain-containing protein n=1 Tax=Pedobacter sp. TaxID=1411316 RepID=UPI003D7FD7FE